ncbi:phosphatases II [Cutaneotrichosporon oleaginosum]|uniref:protein-tyrosine-phosphatase n=1 Tax=Cutaneotrichosporon oleaginosum TaxID=879819 RepID=A0A0J0XCS1_9TREE|nr:phosphatases II [Cutaneotrichosporon oleaginosum]KLT38873.1 phosphatases II [Cutaneotrichosporon oleaginosum]TXT14286.1 hypothetical protein COLE_00479 [Cutaneotrichosporon oleaginosum]
MLSRSASQRGAKLPQLSRRPSAKDDAPADALKPDEDAIDDVFAQVQETGTLDGAARRLAALAAAEDGPGTAQSQRRQGWWDDPEEAAYFAAQGDEDESEIEHLNEVVDGLWIGDLVAAMDAEGMRERGITNVVSLLRPRLDFAPDFAAYAIEIDDAPDTDILTVLPAALQSAAAPQTKAGAVLVHCQAGMSRSATVVAAYLMRHRRLDPVEAVSFLREKRPVVDPSDTFWHQLGLYYLADGRVTLKDRSTRQFYLERTTGYVMSECIVWRGQPATPAGGHRRKIRCKMCRQHLALREHMMDHILDHGSAASSPPNTNPPSPAEPRRRASSTLQFTPAAPHPAAGGITGGPPILVNPKCSGYFVEPLTWMEPVLANGDVAGKLVCPNPKCGAKIGSYDWAGVQCGCKEWVTPVCYKVGRADGRDSASRAARSMKFGNYIGNSRMHCSRLCS